MLAFFVSLNTHSCYNYINVLIRGGLQMRVTSAGKVTTV